MKLIINILFILAVIALIFLDARRKNKQPVMPEKQMKVLLAIIILCTIYVFIRYVIF